MHKGELPFVILAEAKPYFGTGSKKNVLKLRNLNENHIENLAFKLGLPVKWLREYSKYLQKAICVMNFDEIYLSDLPPDFMVFDVRRDYVRVLIGQLAVLNLEKITAAIHNRKSFL